MNVINKTQLKKTILTSVPNGIVTRTIHALVFTPGASIGNWELDPNHIFVPDEDGYCAHVQINLDKRVVVPVHGIYGPDLPSITYFAFPGI